VAKTCSRVRPWRFSFGGREAKTVLELAPGALDQVPLRVGEQLRIEPLEGRADDTRKTGDLAGPPPAEVTR
jgi:uncharacterized membrane protein (UPF0127 family)